MKRIFNASFVKNTRSILFLCACLFLLTAYLVHPKNKTHLVYSPTTPQINELSWDYVPGTKNTSRGLYVISLDRKIVNQDGTGGQPNPPVNVRGGNISINGNYKISFGLDSLPENGSADIYLYSKVPIIYDEWRYEPPHFLISINQTSISLSRWDGKSDVAASKQTWSTSKSVKSAFDLVFENNTFSIYKNNLKISDFINSYTIDKQIWFGLDDTGNNSGWYLTSLKLAGKASVVPPVSVDANKIDSRSLRSLGAKTSRKIPVGAAVAGYALFSDKQYRDTVSSQFSMLTPENELKPQFIHPGLNTYSFAEADSLVDFAQANNMKVHGHTLVFSEANPAWMQNSALTDRPQIMTNHIKNVVSHFGNKINEWDVVNEPLSDDNNNIGSSEDLRKNVWFNAMGENYIDTAFKTARASNPNAKLYINEYGLEADGERWDEFLSLIKRLQTRSVPIDGVGFQSHVYEPGDEIDQNVLQQHIKILAGMGLLSRVSELDVYGDDGANQAEQYSIALKACLNSPSCTSFTVWGVTDKYGSTTEIHNYPLDFGNDLLWDKNMNPKLAYTELVKTFENFR